MATLRSYGLVVAASALVSGAICVACVVALALASMGCPSCSHAPPPSMWEGFSGYVFLASAVLFVAAVIVIIVGGRPIAWSAPRRRRLGVVAACLVGAAVTTWSASILTFFHHDVDDLQYAVYACVGIAAVALVAAIVARRPPPIPPAKIA